MFLTTFFLFTIFTSVFPQELSSDQKILPGTEYTEIQYLPPPEYQIGRISVKPCPKDKIIAQYLKEKGIPSNSEETDKKHLQNAKGVIITVPTPEEEYDEHLQEDLTLKQQSQVDKPETDSKLPLDSSNRRTSQGASIESNENKLDYGKNQPTSVVNRGYRTEAQEIEAKTVELFEDCLKEKINKILRGLDDNVDTRRSLISHNENDADEESYDRREISPRYKDPTAGASSIAQTKVSLIQNPRICFACSTATNPTCWEPNRRTTVKYCNKNHNACVTKTFGTGASLTLIRDCADTCHDTSVPGIEPKYKSCSLCHSDLCNGAFSINKYNLFIILFITLIKCTFY